jgi:EAL domain-containing protein (putative c-di-GMP-specific phosphodiesterase class I)
MIEQQNYKKLSCAECSGGAGLDFSFTMAYQPIVNVTTREIFAQEALVRGLENQSAAQVFEHVNDSNRYRFDQACRVKALEVASQVGITGAVSINFMPMAVYRPELCIRTTLEAADRFGFSVDQIILEITEGEKVEDAAHLRNIIEHYKQRGFRTAIDDFGAGYAGLNLLADFPVDLIKLDIALIKNIDKDRIRRSIVKGIVQVCADLSIQIIGEGVETRDELNALRDLGIELFQGYYFARPAFQAQATVAPELYN